MLEKFLILAKKTTPSKNLLKLDKIQNLVAKCCKIRKICGFAKFADFVYICITCGNCYHF